MFTALKIQQLEDKVCEPSAWALEAMERMELREMKAMIIADREHELAEMLVGDPRRSRFERIIQARRAELTALSAAVNEAKENYRQMRANYLKATAPFVVNKKFTNEIVRGPAALAIGFMSRTTDNAAFKSRKFVIPARVRFDSSTSIANILQCMGVQYVAPSVVNNADAPIPPDPDDDDDTPYDNPQADNRAPADPDPF